jgi:hypothetical protein
MNVNTVRVLVMNDSANSLREVAGFRFAFASDERGARLPSAYGINSGPHAVDLIAPPECGWVGASILYCNGTSRFAGAAPVGAGGRYAIIFSGGGREGTLRASFNVFVVAAGFLNYGARDAAKTGSVRRLTDVCVTQGGGPKRLRKTKRQSAKKDA